MQPQSLERLAIPALLFLVGAVAACQSVAHPPQQAAQAIRECALCEKPIPVGGEVLLVTDLETSYYRCPHCALTAQAQFTGASVLKARSLMSAGAIHVHHDGARWSVAPPTAVFLSLPETAGECIDRHRIFSDRAEFDAYLLEHPEFGGEAPRAYTLDELVQILAAGLPEDGAAQAETRELALQVVVVGMTTHLPFKTSVLPEIVGALESFEGRVGRQFVDATQPAGLAILGAHGIHEHLPVVIFINGQSEFTLDGREVRFRGFPGESQWTRAELQSVLASELARLGE